MTPASPTVPQGLLGTLAPETASLGVLAISCAILLFPFALGFLLSSRTGDGSGAWASDGDGGCDGGD